MGSSQGLRLLGKARQGRAMGDRERQRIERCCGRESAVAAATAPESGLRSYPENLPVSQRAEDIRALIEKHQVVVIAGETGSGKTTQLPKICLEAGCGQRGLIGHTQPRRIAARSVSARLIEEMGAQASRYVGYQVRFTDTTSDEALIKVMTDGILLAEVVMTVFSTAMTPSLSMRRMSVASISISCLGISNSCCQSVRTCG